MYFLITILKEPLHEASNTNEAVTVPSPFLDRASS